MTATGGPANPPAGWYPDPSGQPQLRWWDGIAWGEQTQAGQAPGTFGQPTYPAWSPSPAYGSAPATTGNGLSTAGIICGALAFLILPIILGPAGLILGGMAKSRGQSRANVALWVSGLGLVGGIIIGVLTTSALLHS